MRYALTLVELLVVISLIVILSGMILAIPDNEDPAQLVKQAAAELESTLKEARKLAIEHNKTYAVVFNLENSGDSSVMKNYSQFYDGQEVRNGRHWYAIIGPDLSHTSRSLSEPPIPSGYSNIRTLQFAVTNNIVGSKRYLPIGTRFLALGDIDYGNLSSESRYQDGDKGPAHPIPWFGYYDSGRLYPWGAYDKDQDLAYRNSQSNIKSCTTAFCYEGMDGAIPYDASIDCNVGPASGVHGKLYDTPTATATMRYPGYGGTKDTGLDAEYTFVGKARPIFDGLTLDYALLFLNDGRCVPFTNGRRGFYEPQWHGSRYRSPYGLKHVHNKTGGYYITVARDVDPLEEIYVGTNANTNQPDYTAFNSVDDAFKSISPYKRIFVQKDTGDVSVRHDFHQDAYLEPEHMEQKDPYPPKVIPDY